MAFYGSLGIEGDRMGIGMVVGMLVGIAGVAVLVDPEWAGTSGGRPLIAVGLIVLVGSQAWCGGSVLAKRKLAHVPALVNAAIHSLTAGVFLLLVDLIWRGGGIPRASAAAWASLAYLTVFGSVVAYSAYVYLVAHMAPARAGTYSYINPVVAVLLGWLLLQEPVTWRVVVGGLVILSGLFIVRRARLVPRSGPTPIPTPTET